MDDDSVIQVIVRFYKEAVHEFLLSSSCHSVLFRGFINRDLQLIAPLHGHNPTMEYVYHEISQSLGVRLKKMILTDQDFCTWPKVHDFLNELTHCIHTLESMCQSLVLYIEMKDLEVTKKNTLQLYMYSFHFIIQKVQRIEQIFREDYLKDADELFTQLTQDIDFF